MNKVKELQKENIDCYRGNEGGCVIYLKDNTEVRTAMSFKEVDKIFNL